jgi:hypothetical protein
MAQQNEMSERSLAQVLAALPAGERTRLEKRLSRASQAVWRARQALCAPHAAETTLTAWRGHLDAAGQALAAADAVVAPHAAREAPRL